MDGEAVVHVSEVDEDEHFEKRGPVQAITACMHVWRQCRCCQSTCLMGMHLHARIVCLITMNKNTSPQKKIHC